MSDQPDGADNAEAQAIDRLERALERIAEHVETTAAQLSAAENLGVEELRARLDQLIVKLRATLAAPGAGHGNGQQ